MKPVPFTYHRAGTLAEAAEMAATLDNARLLSGGQSLMAMMNLRYVAVDHLIDLNPVAEIAGITIGSGRVTLGAMTRQRTVLEDAALAACCPILREALGFVGHVQTRNRGTVGGSLAHLDPAAELPGMAALLEAEITLTSQDGTRRVAMADYPLGYMTPDINEGEILT
ncbi:MAG: FAD binding domain-containing protein, partial [Alphaproteobacteria bacterium]